MARVSDIIFCLRAKNVDGQGVSADTILTALSPEYIPGLFTFSVILTLVDIDTTVEHQLLVQFISPSGEEVVRIESELPVIEDHSNLPNEHKGINVAMDWNNVNLRESGLYTIKVLINNVEVGVKSIFVKGKNE